MTKIVREFSSYGPCIPLGELIKRTAATVVFRDKHDGKVGKRGGHALKCGLIHTEPCRSCRDHPQSSYPNGYEN